MAAAAGLAAGAVPTPAVAAVRAAAPGTPAAGAGGGGVAGDGTAVDGADGVAGVTATGAAVGDGAGPWAGRTPAGPLAVGAAVTASPAPLGAAETLAAPAEIWLGALPPPPAAGLPVEGLVTGREAARLGVDVSVVGRPVAGTALMVVETTLGRPAVLLVSEAPAAAPLLFSAFPAGAGPAPIRAAGGTAFLDFTKAVIWSTSLSVRTLI